MAGNRRADGFLERATQCERIAMRTRYFIAGAAFWVAAAISGWASEPDRAGLAPGNLPAAFLTGGPNCVAVPDWQVHAYNEDFYILRESGCIDAEKPFLYLIF